MSTEAQDAPMRVGRMRRWRRPRWTIGLRCVDSDDVVELGWLTFPSFAEADGWVRSRRTRYRQTEWIVIPPKSLG